MIPPSENPGMCVGPSPNSQTKNTSYGPKIFSFFNAFPENDLTN